MHAFILVYSSDPFQVSMKLSTVRTLGPTSLFQSGVYCSFGGVLLELAKVSLASGTSPVDEAGRAPGGEDVQRPTPSAVPRRRGDDGVFGASRWVKADCGLLLKRLLWP